MSEQKQRYEYPDGTMSKLLSWTEAANEGFCPMCGFFVLGSEEDRTLHSHGVCAECLEQIKYETGEYPEDDYYDDAGY